ncbi:MAG: hypothetical protein HYS17_01140 [Micavibrio aeruginosavorus]|uniref:Uncharacterized protein n=1 Tax=Micavibrio aeruginosavorus TaxID=349221 RepID=A0A7T5R2M8_9BACT|nr:MAG: hypothetical protein HYS17_01140 [Micavibrio aeruginosavorus]
MTEVNISSENQAVGDQADVPPRGENVLICYIMCSSEQFKDFSLCEKPSHIHRMANQVGLAPHSFVPVTYGARHWRAVHDGYKIIDAALSYKSCSNQKVTFYFYIEDLAGFKRHVEGSAISCLNRLGFLRDLSELHSECQREIY